MRAKLWEGKYCTIYLLLHTYALIIMTALGQILIFTISLFLANCKLTEILQNKCSLDQGVGDPEKGVWGRVDKWQGLRESWRLQATGTGQMCGMAPVCSLILGSIFIQIKHSLKKGFIDDNTAFFINRTKTSCRLQSKILGYIRKKKKWKVIKIN